MSAAARRPELLSYGDRGLLVQLGSLEEVLSYAAALQAHPSPAVGAIVPAARTVLAVASDDVDLHELRRVLLDVVPATAGAQTSDGELVEVPVTYDGEDLADVARLTGLSEHGVVAAHGDQTWRVAFSGFAPGFAYLVGEHDRLHVPRREEARTEVPVGAVGLAGEYSGVYPRVSPGGWQLIGRTDAALWDLHRDPPALLRPGGRVRFVAAGGAS